jgi:hypothetical protein
MRFGGLEAIRETKPEMEKKSLKDQAEILQSQLDAVKQRLSEMESGNKTS